MRFLWAICGQLKSDALPHYNRKILETKIGADFLGLPRWERKMDGICDVVLPTYHPFVGCRII